MKHSCFFAALSIASVACTTSHGPGPSQESKATPAPTQQAAGDESTPSGPTLNLDNVDKIILVSNKEDGLELAAFSAITDRLSSFFGRVERNLSKTAPEATDAAKAAKQAEEMGAERGVVEAEHARTPTQTGAGPVPNAARRPRPLHPVPQKALPALPETRTPVAELNDGRKVYEAVDAEGKHGINVGTSKRFIAVSEVKVTKYIASLDSNHATLREYVPLYPTEVGESVLIVGDAINPVPPAMFLEGRIDTVMTTPREKGDYSDLFTFEQIGPKEHYTILITRKKAGVAPIPLDRR